MYFELGNLFDQLWSCGQKSLRVKDPFLFGRMVFQDDLGIFSVGIEGAFQVKELSWDECLDLAVTIDDEFGGRRFHPAGLQGGIFVLLAPG